MGGCLHTWWAVVLSHLAQREQGFIDVDALQLHRAGGPLRGREEAWADTHTQSSSNTITYFIESIFHTHTLHPPSP